MKYVIWKVALIMKVHFLIFLFPLVWAKNEEVAGWKSYFVKPSNYDQLKNLNHIIERLNIDVYSYAAVNREGLVFVPSEANEFINQLKKAGIDYRVHAEDLKKHFDVEDKIFKSKNIRASRFGGNLSYDQYQTVETIYKYLDDIAKAYPNVAKVVSPRNSYNGVPIKYMKISTTNFEDTSKPIIFIDGGIHGREWLTIPPVTYAVHKLVENVTQNDLLDQFDWILLPIVNPDGYTFSRVVNAPWRKTRSLNSHPLSPVCPGVDIDRNFDFFWNTVGTSDMPCSYVYPGNHSFSEVETTVVRDILKENKRILMYISFSSFGSQILYPWGHDGTFSSQGFALHSVGISIAEEIHRNQLPHFLDYVVGNAALVRGVKMSGTSIDYAHSEGVPFTYSIELPGLFGGYFMNPIYIKPVCYETWQGIVSGVRRARSFLNQ